MLTNVGYMDAPRNTGFPMMPNEIQAWQVGDNAFEIRGTTGFMITIDMSSADPHFSKSHVKHLASGKLTSRELFNWRAGAVDS